MLDNTHTAIYAPGTNRTLWRYTDLTKLLSLLETRKLFFPRSDRFDDPYEGAQSRAGVALVRNQLADAGVDANVINQILSNNDQFRESMFISCWCAQEFESAAMWKLYLQSQEGVAIRTSHDRLCAELVKSPLRIRTSMVQYVDYDSVVIPMGNVFFPFVHKRLSFAHESELRAIIWSIEDVNRPQISEGTTIIGIDVDPNALIEAVHVSPTAPRWFGDLVEQLMVRYGLNAEVIRSTLYERPTYPRA